MFSFSNGGKFQTGDKVGYRESFNYKQNRFDDTDIGVVTHISTDDYVFVDFPDGNDGYYPHQLVLLDK